MRILVLDDDDVLARSAARGFASEGHDVVTERDPDAALELVGAGEEFDLILCDRRMPTMYGDDFVDEVRAALGTDAPLLALMVDPNDGAASSDVADRVLRKPLRTRELLALVTAAHDAKALRTHALTQRATRLAMIAS